MIPLEELAREIVAVYENDPELQEDPEGWEFSKFIAFNILRAMKLLEDTRISWETAVKAMLILLGLEKKDAGQELWGSCEEGLRQRVLEKLKDLSGCW